MLQKLEFTLEHANKKCRPEAAGSIHFRYGFEDHPEDILVMTNHEHEFWKALDKDEDVRLFHVRPIEDGVYQTNGFNFNHDIEDYSNFDLYGHNFHFGKNGAPIEIDYTNRDTPLHKLWNKTMSAYGVADNIEQVKEHFKKAIAHKKNKIVISFVEITKEDQPNDGGWRWRKWGQYIGTQDPQCEYIHDEPVIESVICFHAYMVKEK